MEIVTYIKHLAFHQRLLMSDDIMFVDDLYIKTRCFIFVFDLFKVSNLLILWSNIHLDFTVVGSKKNVCFV